VQFWFLIGGIAGVLMMGGAFFVPAIMQLEEQAQARQAVIATGNEPAPTAEVAPEA
jgi:hypothetical protein